MKPDCIQHTTYNICIQCMWTITNIRKHHVDTNFNWILRENPSTIVYTKIQQTQKALHANVFVYSNLNRCNSIGFHVILGNLVFPIPTITLSHWKPEKQKNTATKKVTNLCMHTPLTRNRHSIATDLSINNENAAAISIQSIYYSEHCVNETKSPRQNVHISRPKSGFLQAS